MLVGVEGIAVVDEHPRQTHLPDEVVALVPRLPDNSEVIAEGEVQRVRDSLHEDDVVRRDLPEDPRQVAL